MIATGQTGSAGAQNVTHVPLPARVEYKPVERSVPFTMAQVIPESEPSRTHAAHKDRTVKRSVAKHKGARRSTRGPAPRDPRHVPWNEQAHIVESRRYLATPKVCGYCGSEFSAREGERIDGYRRRETCDRKCARQLGLKRNRSGD